LTQSVQNYAAIVEQLSRQATQISNQVKQIEQAETQLKRMGDMAAYTHLVGFSQFQLDVSLPTHMQTWSSGISNVDGTGMFGDTRSGMYAPVSPTYLDWSGTSVARDATLYKPSQDVMASVNDFQSVQSDVYQRRSTMKAAIAQTSLALQAATTEAEQQKLAALLSAQYGELAAVDSEASLSAAEVQVKTAESNAMATAQNTAATETRSELAQQEITKASTVFKPSYDCLLQYVTEKNFSDSE